MGSASEQNKPQNKTKKKQPTPKKHLAILCPQWKLLNIYFLFN